MREELIQKVAAAMAAIDAAKAKPRHFLTEAAQLERRQDAADVERFGIREAEEADAVRRLIDGPDAAPEKPRRRNRMKVLDDEAPVLAAGILEFKNRAKAATAEIEPLKVPLAEASLRLVGEVQGDGIVEMREALSQLAPAAARLLAGDHILAQTVGTSGFPVPPGAPLPVKGSLLVEKLIGAIPPVLMPDSLKPDELAAAARAISTPIISKLKGSKND